MARAVAGSSRTALAALTGTHGQGALLWESGREGRFVFNSADLSTLVSADTRQGIHIAPASDPTGASGAWVRKFDGPFNAKWFGAVGDGVTNDAAAIQAAIDTSLAMRFSGTYYGYGRGGPAIHVPASAGPYYMGSTTLEIYHAVILSGDGGSGPSGDATVFKWDDGVTGIRVHAYNTSGASSTVAGRDYSATGTIIRGLMLVGGFAGTESESHGVHLRTKAKLEDLFVSTFSGDGIYASADNVNNSTIKEPFVYGCRNGIYLYANDSNALLITNPHCRTNRRYGMFIEGTLGSTIIGGDMSANGQAGGFPTMVSYNGHYYSVLPGQDTGASTNAPSGAATTNTWWLYESRIGDGAPTATRPAWVSGTAYRSGGTLRVEGSSEYCTIVGMYREIDQASAHLQGPTFVVAGLFSAVQFDGTPWAGHLTAAQGEMNLQGNVIPLTTNAYNIGSPSARFAYAYSTRIDASLAFYVNGTKVIESQKTGCPAAATDLASVITLANFLRTSGLAHGLIAT